MKSRIIRALLGSLLVIILVGIAIKLNIDTRKEIIESTDKVQNINDNLVNIYDNGYKLYKKVRDDAEKPIKNKDSKSISLLETDFNYCKFNVLSIWNEEVDSDDLYYNNNEPETTEVEDETTTVESESIELLVSSIESETETTEAKEVKPLTFCIIDIYGYYNENTVNNMYFEFYKGEEFIGTTKEDEKNIKVTNIFKSYNQSILLFEIPGTYKDTEIQYKPVVTNKTNIVEGNIQELIITESKQSRNYSILTVNNENILAIKKESLEGSNRIDLIDITEEETTESTEYIETTEETTESTKDNKQNIGPGITTSHSTESETTKSYTPIKKYRKYQKEVYNLNYGFDCWGKSSVLKEFNGSAIELVRKENNEAVEIADNMQIKYNDSKYNIGEADDIFIELSFSVNIQLSKEKVNEYMESNSLKPINNQTINTVKNGLNNIFALRLYNDSNSNVINDIR